MTRPAAIVPGVEVMMMMIAEGGGSFRDLRKRHLMLFDESVHRHDRGWPHSPDDAESRGDEAKERRKGSERGILLKG